MEIKTEMQQVVEAINRLESEMEVIKCDISSIRCAMCETAKHLRDASNSLDRDVF